MRILYNSRESRFKTPFGTLLPEQTCTLHIHVPIPVQADYVACELLHEDMSAAQVVKMEKETTKGA